MVFIKLFFRSLKFYRKFGLQGLLLVININIGKKKLIKYFGNNFKYPIYLRRNSTDFYIFTQIFYSEEYNFIFDETPNTIIDCGANIGLSTIYFKTKFPEAKIIAIEPDKTNFDLLIKNTENYSDITCINGAIWNSSINLELLDLNLGEWAYMTKEGDEAISNPIQGYTISEIMKLSNIETIDLLKIDIEGAEKEVFTKNYSNWLASVKNIIIELHDRLVENASKSFFKAIIDYNFSLSIKGENILCKFNHSNLNSN